MTLKTLSPEAARQRLDHGAVLVDIRAADERAREHIAESRHMPLDRLAAQPLPADGAAVVIFYCRSGNRTQMNAQRLRACVAGEGYLLEGGLDGWKRAGLPVVADARQPLELQRQVQIAAGALVLLGTALGITVSPWFLALAGFVGAGLLFAGVSGYCGLARVLMKAPWNRRVMAD
ncbi:MULTISPECIES: rhodanese family protein [Cupriavidus]|uniref:rhodanese family protein n=1 Tax=Cupriavidus sp. WS TaxID=1312922 RepID=UPI000378EA1D|nr:rhodanese family protein [Cupriavidus sp. WS]